MLTYHEKAEQRIVQDLYFSSEQLDLVGRIISLKEKTALVHHIDFDYSDASLSEGYFLSVEKSLEKSRKINMDIILQKVYETLSHQNLEKKLKQALKTVGVGTQDLFSYCSHSYGILRENEGIEIHFG